MSKQEKKYFTLEAESLAVVGSGEGIKKIVMFRPTKNTLERLRNLSSAADIGPLRLIDKWDDGTEDVHTHETEHSYVALAGSGSFNKSHTFTLTLVDTSFFKGFVE